jgi:hypothetical protein
MITGMGDARIVRLSLRVYSLLLASYPQSFRQQYAPHMLQAFGDYTRRVNLQRGFPGMLWWWTLTLFDFLNSVVEEHLQRIIDMTKEKFIRLGAWFYILGALSLFVTLMSMIRPKYDPFNFASRPMDQYIQNAAAVTLPAFALLLAIGTFAFFLRYAQGKSKLAERSLQIAIVAISVTFVIGLAWSLDIFTTESDTDFTIWLYGIVVYYSGLALFGIAAVRRKLMPGWNLMPIIVGLSFPLPMLISQSFNINFPANSGIPIVYALTIGMLLLGARLVKDSKGEMAK